MLDLDAVQSKGGEIVVGGKKYAFRALTVEEHLAVMKLYDEMDATSSYAGKVVCGHKAMRIMATDLPESVFKKMDLEQMQAFVTYLKEVQLGIKPGEDDTKNADAGGAIN